METTKLKSLQALSVSVTEAREILAECRDASQLKEVVARGSAAAKYLRQTLGAAEDATRDAQEIALWASRRLGEVLLEMPKHPGGRPAKTAQAYRGVSTLAELKLSHDRAARLQSIARIPEGQFEEYLRWSRHVGRLPSVAGVMQSAGIASSQGRRHRAPRGKYDVITIDPPWPMKWWGGMPYPTMSLDEIKGLKLRCAPNCWVFVWVPQSFLPVSFEVLASWGLTYSWTMTWLKTGRCGWRPSSHVKLNSEFVVVARQGSPKMVRGQVMPTCFSGPNRGHSTKPEEFYDLVRGGTQGKRLDMFARSAHEGFRAWGNEAPTGQRADSKQKNAG